MCPIKNTILFKSLLSLHAPEDQGRMSDEVALALADAAAHTPVRWNTPSPNTAMTWDRTPQGQNYWQAYDNMYERKRRGA